MNIEDKVYLLLKQKGYKVSTAESCTGGLLSATIINVSGASEIIDMAFVTYSNEAKQELLGVKSDTLKKYGAVSEQTASEMACGVKNRANSNVGLSTTGIAGPTGGTDKKPVGMVCFGICINNKTYTYTNIFDVTDKSSDEMRSFVRKSSVNFILEKLYNLLKEE